MLWLALVFPKLPLEAQSERAAVRQTVAGAFVVERGHVCVVDEAAEAAGVMPGMRFSTARSILPEGRVIERDAAAIGREQRALEAFACFAGSVTPGVSIEAPATLLLDIGGCLRLFGGIAPIVKHLRCAGVERGVTLRVGIAPSPRGAQWLARHEEGEKAICLTLEALPDMLAPLPIAVLEAGSEVTIRLQAFGARTVGDLLALPRASLARRIGAEPVAVLLQAVGELPDPRAPVAFPESFHLSVELPAPASDAAMLGFPARRLIADFCGWLAARQSGATRCTLLLTPERRGLPVQGLELRLAGASRDPLRFQRLLRERLERTPLAAPVGDITLEAGAPGEVVPLPGQNASLFDHRPVAVPLDALIERLRARLGEGAIHGLRIQPDHRPECATRVAAIGFADGPAGKLARQRPLTLLDPPEALDERNGRPARRGEVLELLSGPERIESGWWDEGETSAGPESGEMTLSGGRPEQGAGEGFGESHVFDRTAGSVVFNGNVADSVAERSCAVGPGGGGSGVRQTPGDVRRDYFHARSKHGECWWIFRDAAGWWAQGLGYSANQVSDGMHLLDNRLQTKKG